MIAKRVSWPVVLHDESEPNSTDNDATLERAGPFNVTITSNRDLNVNIIFVSDIWQFSCTDISFFLPEK